MKNLAAVYVAILAWMVARACGVPLWRDFDPGDCFDIALVSGLLARLLLDRPWK